MRILSYKLGVTSNVSWFSTYETDQAANAVD